MKPGSALDRAYQRLRRSKGALWYVAAQLAAKAMAAVAQLYAIYVFSKILPPDEAALIFILFGYAIWVQVFELGLSQAIQNALNLRKITVSGAGQIIGLHYGLMVFFAGLIVVFPETLDLLQGRWRAHGESGNGLAFAFGIGLLLVSTNNVLVQRLLLVINRGMVASALVLLQGFLSVLALLAFQWRGATFVESVAVYLFIPILTYAPLVLKLVRNAWRARGKPDTDWLWVLRNAFGFWGLNAMSSVYLGADYFFAAKHLTNAEMVAYHFSSRLFFISYVAYFSYVQYKARSMAAETLRTTPRQIWDVVKGSACIGTLSVVLILVTVACVDWSGGLDVIGANELVVMPLILSAALYYGVRVFRDVGLVIVWNFGWKRLLYAVHTLEVVACLPLLSALAPQLGGRGMFFAMALVAAFSTTVIYVALQRNSPRL